MAAAATPKILWQPNERAVEEAQLTQFARQVVRKRQLDHSLRKRDERDAE